MTMADKIAVLNGGSLEQVGAPLELYRSPANLFVAGFIGSPQMNFITGDLAQRVGADTIGVRPEHLVVSRDGDGWRGRVISAEHLGSDTFIHVEMADTSRLTARTVGDMPVAAGDDVVLAPMEGYLHRFNADGRAL
jgi:multiple sugar transport system ATP-binding protein